MGRRLDEARKVLLFCMPRMVRDMVRGILDGQRGVRVVAELDCEASLSDAVSATGADFVVVSAAQPELTAEARRTLRSRPELRILALATEDGRGFVYEMRPHRVPLGEISPDVLIKALRAPHSDGEVYAGAR